MSFQHPYLMASNERNALYTTLHLTSSYGLRWAPQGDQPDASGSGDVALK
jgi:hypothetical protein